MGRATGHIAAPGLAQGQPRDAGGDKTECAAILLDAGTTITARDEEYRSTPLAWAARVNALKTVEFLLSRGAPTNPPDDAPWATRRGHAKVVEVLRAAGAR